MIPGVAMKTLLPLLSLLPVISAAPSPPPTGFIVTYVLPDCAGASGASGKLQGNTTDLPQNNCVPISLFMSFIPGEFFDCPTGKVASITAWADTKCTAPYPTNSGPLTADHDPDSCVDVDAAGIKGAEVGGQSAMFTCT